MDINRVRYFHVFAETGSLVKASEVLHISQPALSKALRLLEHEVRVSLLEPDGRGLKLTGAGQKFKQETSQLLQQWLQVPERMATQNAAKPTRIGSFEVFTTYFLAQLTKFIELEALELHEYGPGRLERAIADGTVDIGITYAPIPKTGIAFTEVTKLKMGVFGLKKFNSMALQDIPFVVPLMPIEGTPSKVIGLDGWPDHKFERYIQYKVTMMESAMELCRLGLCVAYLPIFVVELHNQSVLPEYRLVEHSSPVPQKDRLQSVFLMQDQKNTESMLFKKIAKALRSLT